MRVRGLEKGEGRGGCWLRGPRDMEDSRRRGGHGPPVGVEMRPHFSVGRSPVVSTVGKESPGSGLHHTL